MQNEVKIAEVVKNQDEKAMKIPARNPERRREVPRPKRHEVPALWRVLNKARAVYEMQLSKTEAVKAECVKRYQASIYADEDRFWIDFMTQVNLLLDSRKFCRGCQNLGVRPEHVAEHVVFMGSATMRKVLREGVESALGREIKMLKERFSPTLADVYREQVEEPRALPAAVEVPAAI